MELVLWRHAEAEDGKPDDQRALTEKGRRQAALVAKWLKPHLPADLRILASPTLRTRQTADALKLAYDLCDQVAPGVEARDVLAAAGFSQGRQDVLVVGHQPTLGRVAALLLAGAEQDWSMKKGAVWWFDVNAQGEATLLAAMTPGLLARR
ncbi:MAG: histidine phosphatase family protein [Pseudomonadota bacterium]|jgi:phosphohistidine phosphatase